MEKKINYFYKITNNVNGKFYYGIHSTNNLEDGYMGSGSRLNYAYKKYGVENFTKEILKFFDTRKECAEYESEIVTEELVHDKNCYNVSCGGEHFNTIGTISVRDIDGKCFRCSKYDEKYLNGEYTPTATGLVSVIENETNNKITITTDEYHSNKDKYSIRKHSICVKNVGDLNNNYFFISQEEYSKNKHLYEHKYKGYIRAKDKYNNYFFVHTSDERLLNGKLKPMWVGWKHSESTKKKISESHRINQHQKGEKNSQFGTCWITKDGINKKIKKEDIETYILDGWNKGRICKK